MEEAYLEFERVNGVKYYEKDRFLKWDFEAHSDDTNPNSIFHDKLWRKDPYYFTTCHISAVVLLQMLLHAKRGEPLEIMGMLRGQTFGREFYIYNVISFPAVGTETLIAIPDDDLTYEDNFGEYLHSNGFHEERRGWFHTHPSYKCWLSSTDVKLEETGQMSDPFLAIVVDPTTTTNNGAVEIGVFRTFPKNFVPEESHNGKRILPSEKIADFGSSWNRYYPLKVEIFKTELDQKMLTKLWRQYWMTTLSASPIIFNKNLNDRKVVDLYKKFEERKKIGMKTSASLKELIEEIDEIQNIYKRGVKGLELKNMLFNQLFDQ